MRNSVFVSIILILLVAGTLQAQNSHKRHAENDASSAHLPGPAIAAFQKINPENIRAHVRFSLTTFSRAVARDNAAAISPQNTSPLSSRWMD